MMKWLLTAFICAATFSVNAQVQFSSLGELLQYADRNSITAKQGKMLVDASREEVGIQRSGLLPKINLSGTADYNPIIATQLIPESVFGGQDGKFRKVQFGLPFGFTSGAELSIPVINLEKWKQLEKAKLQSVQTGWTQKANLENLHIQLTRYYYQELAMKAAVKLNLQNGETVTKLLRIMAQRKQNGVLNPSDYNRSKNLQLDVLNAGKEYERLLAEARIGLHALLNLPDSVEISLNDSLQDFNWPMTNYAANDISNRPGWKEANVKADVAQKLWEESRRAGLPKLSFYSRYTYNWQMKFSTNTNIGFDVSSLGLRFDFPLFQGNFYRGTQTKNELLFQSAKLERDKVKSSLQQQQKEWRNNYTKAHEQHALLLEKTKVAADNLRIAELNMKEGVMEFNEYNEIFLEYNKAQLDYLQNLSDGILYYLLLTQNVQ
ncbi:MAG: TolC family protein [Chitinophagaceae bacterium]|nr:TolC family protein [Chitinophagaceae bacterium]